MEDSKEEEGEGVEKLSEELKEEVKEQQEPKKSRKEQKKDNKNDKKAKVVEEEDIEESDEQAAKESGHDVDHIRRSRQILVFGVPIDVNKKIFTIIIKKISRKSTVELIKQDNEISDHLQIVSPPGKILLVTSPSRKEATKVLQIINKSNLNNLGFTKYIDAKNLENNKEEDDEDDDEDNNETDNAAFESLKLKNKLKDRLVARLLSDITLTEHRKRKCRLIIRNLSFQAIERNIIDKMQKFGPLVSVEIPTETIEKKAKRAKHKAQLDENSEDAVLLKEKPKGFGFVTFLCEKDANEVVSNSSGLKVCNREVAVDFCMSKTTYIKYGKEGEETEENAENKTNEETGEDKDDEEDNNEEEEDDEEEDSESIEGEEDNDDDDDEEDLDENDDEEDKKEAQDSKDNKPRKYENDVEEGKTLFVRGLPFDATPENLMPIFAKFGRVEMILIVKDKLTNVSKGSAFVKYCEQTSISKCLQQLKHTGTDHQEGEMTVMGRSCKITLAVNRSAAQQFQNDTKTGKDKRNMYLANEGLVTTGEAEKVMSEFDREKRIKAQADKKKKLTNPLFFISPIRLSIRNLSKTISDKDLRLLCLKGTKQGLEKHLVTKQDMSNLQLAQGSLGHTHEEFEIPKFNHSQCIKSCKIMFDPTKVRNEIPQSRGYAFVEFSHHAYALACLRELNNNPEYCSQAIDGNKMAITDHEKSRILAEFSLENIRKVKILQERQQRAKLHSMTNKRKHSEMSPEGVSDSNAESNGKKGKRPYTPKSKKPKTEPAASPAPYAAPKPAPETNGNTSNKKKLNNEKLKNKQKERKALQKKKKQTPQ